MADWWAELERSDSWSQYRLPATSWSLTDLSTSDSHAVSLVCDRRR